MATPEPTTLEQTNTATQMSTTDAEVTKAAVQKQIEYYFSLENLPNDSFLLSNMNSERFVPISLLATFGKVQSLTQDISVLVEALESSTTVELSEDKSGIRFKDTRKKTTLILYNLPSETTDQTLRDLFKKGDFEPSITADINNCWFVECSNEEVAAAALQFIKKEKIDEKSIRARLKPLRNIYAALDSYNPNYAPVPYSSAPVYVYNEWSPEGSAAGVPMYWNPQQGDYEKGRARKGKRDNRKDGNKKRTNKKKQGKEAKKQTPVQLGSADFPPLPSTTGENTGYSGAFNQFTGAAISSAWKQLPVTDVNESKEFPFQEKPCENLSSADAKPIERSDLSDLTRNTAGRSRSKSQKKKKASAPAKAKAAQPAPTPSPSS